MPSRKPTAHARLTAQAYAHLKATQPGFTKRPISQQFKATQAYVKAKR